MRFSNIQWREDKNETENGRSMWRTVLYRTSLSIFYGQELDTVSYQFIDEVGLLLRVMKKKKQKAAAYVDSAY